jgi:hypothetical protein
MRIAQRQNEIARFKSHDLRHHHRQERVGGYIEWFSDISIFFHH